MDLREIIKKFKNEVNNVKDLEELKQLKAKYISKSKFLNDLKKKIKITDNKQKVGLQIKEYLTKINQLLISKKEELENAFFLEKRENPLFKKMSFDLKTKKGKMHPLTKISFIVEDFFDKLNYNYAHAIEVENEKINFDILNLPESHPARKMQDTFFLEKKGFLLRTHSTNVSARELINTNKNEYASYSIGPVFRNDDNDATHSFQFNQIDLFNMGTKISIANLKWTLIELIKNIFGKNIEIRFRPSYFPFTEPSFEVDIRWEKKWMEILGSGMFNNQVIKNVGKDPHKVQAFAAGIGLERIVMIKYNIKDIRDFYINDIEFLSTYDK